MAREWMEIGSAPEDEHCVQVDPKVDYLPAMRAECLRFLELIRKKLGEEPPGSRLAVKSNLHDFGQYLEVVCHYDDTDEDATAYAHLCESMAPRTWSDDAPLTKHQWAVSVELEVRVLVEAESEHMAKVRARRQAVAKAQQAGFQLDFPREADAYGARKVA